MDIFYYWKNFESDLANSRIGWLISQRHKLQGLVDRHPGFIWAFRTPPGRKGELQVLARLEWASDRPKRVSAPAAESTIFYDPLSERTVRFLQSDSDASIASITSVIKRRFHSAFRSNSKGTMAFRFLRTMLCGSWSRP